MSDEETAAAISWAESQLEETVEEIIHEMMLLPIEIEELEATRTGNRAKRVRIIRDLEFHKVDLLMTDPQHFRKATRFSCDEFLNILATMEANYPICNTKWDTKTKLFLFLNRMRGGASLMDATSLIGVGLSTTHYYFQEMFEKMCVLYHQVISWPDAAERAELERVMEDFPGCIGLTDGTHIQIGKPKVNESTYYSGKHCKHTLNFQVTCNWYGRIISVLSGYPGSVHDRTIFTNSYQYRTWQADSEEHFSRGTYVVRDLEVRIYEKLKDAKAAGRTERMLLAQNQIILNSQYVLGDPGYKGDDGNGPVVVPYALKLEASEAKYKKFNRRQRFHRVVIELVNAGIKLRFGILRRINHRKEELEYLFVAACLLYNLQGVFRGSWLRADDYRVRSGSAWDVEALDGMFSNIVARALGKPQFAEEEISDFLKEKAWMKVYMQAMSDPDASEDEF